MPGNGKIKIKIKIGKVLEGGRKEAHCVGYEEEKRGAEGRRRKLCLSFEFC